MIPKPPLSAAATAKFAGARERRSLVAQWQWASIWLPGGSEAL